MCSSRKNTIDFFKFIRIPNRSISDNCLFDIIRVNDSSTGFKRNSVKKNGHILRKYLYKRIEEQCSYFMLRKNSLLMSIGQVLLGHVRK